MTTLIHTVSTEQTCVLEEGLRKEWEVKKRPGWTTGWGGGLEEGWEEMTSCLAQLPILEV